MNAHPAYFVLAVAALLMALCTVLIVSYLRVRRPRAATWESLIAQLISVDRDQVETIALDLVDEAGQRRTEEDEALLEPSTIWSMIGGLEGLEILEHNCRVLVEIACYLQRTYPEAMLLAEQLRVDARELEWHVARLKGAAGTGKLESSFPTYAPRAIAIYYFMTKQVLAAYQQTSFPGLSDLQRAL